MNSNSDVKSPWAVSDLEEFRYYNCPVCNVEDPLKNNFVIHALQNHPECKEYLGPLMFKQEIHEEAEEENEDFHEKNIKNTDFRSAESLPIQSDQYGINHFVSTDDHFQKDSKIKEELVDNEDENQEIEHDYYTAEELYENYPNEYLEQQYENENYEEELSTRTNYEPEVHIGEKKFQCTFCEKSFTLQSNLKRHTEQIHQKKKHECPECHKHFGRSDILKEHIKCVHGDEPSYKCDYLDCEKMFQSRPAKKAHMDSVHKNLPKKKVSKQSKLIIPKELIKMDQEEKAEEELDSPQTECPKCGKLVNNVINHLKRYHKGSKHQCEFCDFSFSNFKVLVEHLKKDHEGLQSQILEQQRQEKHICELCGKNFTRNRGLVEHVENIHNGKKDFKCQFCQKEFSLKNNMVAHIKMVSYTYIFFTCDSK